MPNSSSAWAGASNSRFCKGMPASAMFIVAATSLYWGRLDNDRARRTHWEQGGQGDHQRDSAIVAPLMNRIWGLDQCVTGAHHHGFSRADHARLSNWIIAPVPLDLARENRIGQLSLDDDADLGAWMMVNRQHRSGHDRDPTERKLRIFHRDRCGTTEDLAGDGRRRGSFRGNLLGERNWRAGSPYKTQAAHECPDEC